MNILITDVFGGEVEICPGNHVKFSHDETIYIGIVKNSRFCKTNRKLVLTDISVGDKMLTVGTKEHNRILMLL